MSWSLLRFVTDAPQACVHTQPPPYIVPSSSIPAALDDGEQIRVLHAPSNRATKNTDMLERALRGIDGIELEVAGGYPNGEILARMRLAHVYADQFDPRYGGGLGGAAHEALAHGLVLVSNAQNICWAIRRWYPDLPPIHHVWNELTLREWAQKLAKERDDRLCAWRGRSHWWASKYLTPRFVYRHWWRCLNFED